jgi:hypothetical protein
MSQMMGSRGKPRRAITHIGCLFSDLVVTGQLSFFAASPDSKILHRVQH